MSAPESIGRYAQRNRRGRGRLDSLDGSADDARKPMISRIDTSIRDRDAGDLQGARELLQVQRVTAEQARQLLEHGALTIPSGTTREAWRQALQEVAAANRPFVEVSASNTSTKESMATPEPANEVLLDADVQRVLGNVSHQLNDVALSGHERAILIPIIKGILDKYRNDPDAVTHVEVAQQQLVLDNRGSLKLSGSNQRDNLLRFLAQQQALEYLSQSIHETYSRTAIISREEFKQANEEAKNKIQSYDDAIDIFNTLRERPNDASLLNEIRDEVISLVRHQRSEILDSSELLFGLEKDIQNVVKSIVTKYYEVIARQNRINVDLVEQRKIFQNAINEYVSQGGSSEVEGIDESLHREVLKVVSRIMSLRIQEEQEQLEFSDDMFAGDTILESVSEEVTTDESESANPLQTKGAGNQGAVMGTSGQTLEQSVESSAARAAEVKRLSTERAHLVAQEQRLNADIASLQSGAMSRLPFIGSLIRRAKQWANAEVITRHQTNLRRLRERLAKVNELLAHIEPTPATVTTPVAVLEPEVPPTVTAQSPESRAPIIATQEVEAVTTVNSTVNPEEDNYRQYLINRNAEQLGRLQNALMQRQTELRRTQPTAPELQLNQNHLVMIQERLDQLSVQEAAQSNPEYVTYLQRLTTREQIVRIQQGLEQQQRTVQQAQQPSVWQRLRGITPPTSPRLININQRLVLVRDRLAHIERPNA